MDREEEIKRQQAIDLEESLARGGAFEAMVREKGWELVSAYIQNQIRIFTTKAIKEGFKNMEEYSYERGLVEGLRRLLGNIESSLNQLEEYRKKQNAEDSK